MVVFVGGNMVKGSSKGSRASGLSLLLECKNEELSEAQVAHRKKQLEDLSLLQSLLQAAAQKELSSCLTNGGSRFPTLANITNSTDASNNSNQMLHNMLSRKRNANDDSGPPSKKRQNLGNKNNAAQKKDDFMLQNKMSNTTITSMISKPTSITQALRATRKQTGSLPPPKVTLPLPVPEPEPEIEVIQETRPNAGPGLGLNLLGKVGTPASKSMVPKPNIGIRNPPKTPVFAQPHVKANNALLLNLNVRPRSAASFSVNSVKRKELDGKVKIVLMKSPSEFVEWLLKQGLIRSQQSCSTHKTGSRQPAKLKLGMFSDPKVLTSSGGYVWIGECCGRKYISVYSGSVFGSTPIDKVPPTSLLKLIYHWSCQTSIPNVETWVKVDKQFISKVYHYLRCICSVILHDKIYDFGFDGTMVELGIVSLGTTTADGSRKAVKVEILGLYDRSKKCYRLFASTPEPASNSRERFLRILKPVKEVVHRNAIIICDQSVDPTCLHSMNYPRVEVCSSSENENDPKTNSIIMYYLRKHVPKMFQAALSQLTEHQVQLTLDELCWREKYAVTSADCFDNVMEFIAYITFREVENPGVLPLLEFVSEFPHSNFRYKAQQNSKGMPLVPASIILAPTNGPPNVLPSQYNDLKCVSPLTHSNKVMTMSSADIVAFESSLAASSPSLSIKSLGLLTNTPKSRTPSSPSLPPSLAPATPADVTSLSNMLQRSTEYKDLEPYFYGRIEGNLTWGQEQNTSVFKCHICSEILDDNIGFYAHLKYHLEGVSAEKERLDLMCPYCTKSFETVNGLNKHKIDVHLMSDLTQVWCRICSEKFQNENLLKTHMMRKHVEAELPYRCEVCHFATSFYYEIINHFAKFHKGAPYVQCHFCLSVKTITPNGAPSFSTRMFQHIQKHSQKINCRSCLLVFYSKYLLNEHRKEHLSCSNVRGVTRYQSPNGYRILQFRPNIRSMPIPTTTVTLPTKNQAALSVTIDDQTNIKIVADDDNLYCIECDAPLNSENHFQRYRKCSKCPYSTSCQNMIVKHAQVFHPAGTNKPLAFFIGASIPLMIPMACACGVVAKSGHHIARHLALCKKKTAYPSTLSNGQSSFEPSMLFKPEPTDLDDSLPILPLSVEIQED